VPIATIDAKISGALTRGVPPMPMRPRRPDLPYTELYFTVVVWRAIFKVLGAIGAGIFFVLYLIVDAIDPDDAANFIAGTVVFLISGSLGSSLSDPGRPLQVSHPSEASTSARMGPARCNR
jgi:hypothetical protein